MTCPVPSRSERSAATRNHGIVTSPLHGDIVLPPASRTNNAATSVSTSWFRPPTFWKCRDLRSTIAITVNFA
jgi:hypothetical protein